MKRRILLLALLFSFGHTSAFATMVLPLTLQQMTLKSGKIFRGTCLGQETALDEQGYPSTYVRFQVEKGLKGTTDGETVLIKTFGDNRSKYQNTPKGTLVKTKTLSAMSNAYETGHEYVLFFYPESHLGFTSAVGGGQGRWEVQEKQGHKTAIGAFPALIPSDSTVKSSRNGSWQIQDLPVETLEAKIKDLL